ncbi:ferritin-like domain-containing protein [Telmatospirillum sp.]|uniref:ferritin-like domain-containing protein n=1 Tax=Telmatospirillum sp. TaxID=2079197 RepID=UPI00284AFF7E|nr:ferritin-like domain-containing protein [Telmatospirillum sp.]MDR3441101.1 ferritin-like domain-containing protein [Telmatospirillum sp.]
MPRWTQDDLPWTDFTPSRLSPGLLKLVKAAALTEYNAARYSQYLRNVFASDHGFCLLIADWQVEEEQHGAVLGRYAELADPGYDFARTFRQFSDGYVIPVEVSRSVRGSCSGELLARCIVETGTSSFYSVLADSCDEPVLKEICRRIAGDEYRHYRLFLDGLRRYQALDRLSLLARLKVAVLRVRESDDDELAFAYHCANEPETPYELRRCNRAYGALAYGLYRFHHTEKAVAMVFKAIGLAPQGRLSRWASFWAWRQMSKRAAAVG